MTHNPMLLSPTRRQFLREILPAGAFACLALGALPARSGEVDNGTLQSEGHKFLDDTGLNYQQVFAFAYRIYVIPLLKRMAEEMGQEKFFEMLKSLAAEVAVVQQTRDMWNELLSGVFWNHVLTREIIEESDRALKYNVTECLWAKTFRESKAEDIGFALFCHPDFARARVAHRRLHRTKTLMQGDEHCDFYFELAA